MITYDFKDGKGPVPAHQHPNGEGWVADTAKVSETAYVGPYAEVSGDAWVFGNAKVFGDARVFGDAKVSGDVKVTRTPAVISGFQYVVVITDSHISVGCQQGTFDYWEQSGVDIIVNEGFSEGEAKSFLKTLLSVARLHGLS